MAFLLALDQGTSSSRSIVFDETGRIVSLAQQEFTQHFPEPGWVEHDATEIWSSLLRTARDAIAKAGITAAQIAAIGITNQRETIVLWDRRTGRPVHHAIVWQDRRTSAFIDELRRTGREPLIYKRTGLVLDAYFSASKLRWLLDHVPGARERAAGGELAAGTIDSWLAFNLTAGRAHLTDVSNASRTMLMNIHSGAWDEELLALFDIPAAILPEIRPSSATLAESAPNLFGHPIPIAGILGDQQSALFGQLCFDPGMVKCTYGTGCFMLMNTGTKAVPSENRLLTTVAWRLGESAPLEYALEGSIFVGGAAIQWLRDGLGLIKSASEINDLAARVPDSGGIFLVPAFTGLGAPYWDSSARGTLVGLTRGSTAAHIARATLEGIAYQVTDLVAAMQSDAGRSLPALRVDGGAAASDLLMQIQADQLGVPIERPTNLETTALGAVLAAGLATGVWPDRAALRKQVRIERVFQPATNPAHRATATARWHQAVERSRGWA
jgi:glycerol kinase